MKIYSHKIYDDIQKNVNLFGDAVAMIGPHGGAFMNNVSEKRKKKRVERWKEWRKKRREDWLPKKIFCLKDTILIEFMPSVMERHMMWVISDIHS